jgi:hypothetical protein
MMQRPFEQAALRVPSPRELAQRHPAIQHVMTLGLLTGIVIFALFRAAGKK